MKIAHIDGVNGDIEMLEIATKLARAKDVDIMAITGDLAGNVFQGHTRKYFKTLSEKYMNLTSMLAQASKGKVRKVNQVVRGVVEGRVNFPGFAPELVEEEKKFAREYLKYEERAREEIRRQYGEAKPVLDKLSQRLVLIPGCTDSKDIDEFFGEYNIHKKAVEIDGVRFVGYGSAPFDPEIPLDLRFPFKSEEGFKHFMQNTDKNGTTVALTHVPVCKFGKSRTYKDTSRMEDYMLTRYPDLLLAGHAVPECLEEEASGTTIVSSGKLSRNGQPSRLGIIEMDGNGYVTGPLEIYRIAGEGEAYRNDVGKRTVSRKRVPLPEVMRRHVANLVKNKK